MSEQANIDLKRTVLFNEIDKFAPRWVPFAGWEMAVQFEGVRQEHDHVRKAVGLFDVSHMGEIFVEGDKSLETLQWLTSNDVARLQAGHAQYSLLTNEKGGIVDDIIIYCLEPQKKYLVCVNAANIEKDEAWMRAHNKGATIRNESSKWGQIAVQGPLAPKLLEKIFGSAYASLKSFHFATVQFEGSTVYVARTGYTGEDGGEIFVPNEKAAALWQSLIKNGAEFDVKPIGLGARDTLRTEMKYSLYGHEITDETNPLEARLGWVVKLAKGAFLGRDPIEKMKQNGTSRELIGFEMIDKGIAREGYRVCSEKGESLGIVTSGTFSPSLEKAVGIAYVPKAYIEDGKEFCIDIRGRMSRARVVPTPFYKK